MYIDQPDLLRLKREMFHVEIRRQALETKFASKRTPTTIQHYPIEKFVTLINKLIATQTLDDNEYTIVNSVLDDIRDSASNNPEQFSEYAEHLRIVKTLLDSMCLSHYPQIAMKASSCFQNVVAMNNHKIYVDEHIDKAFAIYRSWLDCPQFQENGVRGLNQLVVTQGVKELHDFDFVDHLLSVLNDRGQANQHGKILTLFGRITKEIQDDQQVIRILRIASKLVGSTDVKSKIKGLKIIENATKNIQNLQFVLAMKVIQQIFDLVTYSERVIGELAITIICNLTFTIDKEESLKLVDLGILDVILRLLKNQQKSSHRQNGGFILANLMASDFEVIQRILENTKLVDLVFIGMHSDSLLVRKELYHAWKNFIISCTQQQLLHGLSIGLLDYLIMGLGDYDSTIICTSIEGISNSLKKFAGTSIELDILGYLHRKSVGRQIEYLQHSQVYMIYELAYQFMKDHLDSDFY